MSPTTVVSSVNVGMASRVSKFGLNRIIICMFREGGLAAIDPEMEGWREKAMAYFETLDVDDRVKIALRTKDRLLLQALIKKGMLNVSCDTDGRENLFRIAQISIDDKRAVTGFCTFLDLTDDMTLTRCHRMLEKMLYTYGEEICLFPRELGPTLLGLANLIVWKFIERKNQAARHILKSSANVRQRFMPDVPHSARS